MEAWVRFSGWSSANAKLEAPGPSIGLTLLKVAELTPGMASSADREQNGVALSHAPDGPRGLAALEQGAFDAVLLDVMMPGMDGWQTCEQLKANPVTSAIPVIMLTSLDGLDVPETAARVGAAE